VAVASELATYGTAQGGVVCEEAGVVDSPHEFLLVSELYVGNSYLSGARLYSSSNKSYVEVTSLQSTSVVQPQLK
jgi:hypothetical protein